MANSKPGGLHDQQRPSDHSGTPTGNHHLWPNVLITPHTAYYTEHSLSDIVENSIINCLNFEAGGGGGSKSLCAHEPKVRSMNASAAPVVEGRSA